jgi:acetolactate synthase-1/3 small subunit
MKQTTLSLLVDNNPGVLSRIAGLFTRRNYNIETISAGRTQDQRFTRITVLVSGDDQILEQIRCQIEKLEEVRKIIVLEDKTSVCRELLMVKVMAGKMEKQDLIAIADVFRAKIVDVSTETLMMELTGNQNKLDAFLNLLSDYDVVELVRTGITGLQRGMEVLI